MEGGGASSAVCKQSVNLGMVATIPKAGHVMHNISAIKTSLHCWMTSDTHTMHTQRQGLKADNGKIKGNAFLEVCISSILQHIFLKYRAYNHYLVK